MEVEEESRKTQETGEELKKKNRVGFRLVDHYFALNIVLF